MIRQYKPRATFPMKSIAKLTKIGWLTVGFAPKRPCKFTTNYETSIF